ncbi:MAG: DUF3330 domain-containing protein [Betaproteobacteria bacterium]|nr:DUF3330 domain-containing protein [Betaproteobacteria bacterium]
MSDKPAGAPDAPLIACDICRKEVPLSAAFTPEGAEYVEHFCGIECYQQFVAEAKKHEGNGKAGKP